MVAVHAGLRPCCADRRLIRQMDRNEKERQADEKSPAFFKAEVDVKLTVYHT